jgi:hypothetical protein
MTDQLIETDPAADGPAPEPTTGPIRIAWAPVPKVNLLPIEVIEKRRFRRTQIGLAAAVTAVVALGAAGAFWAHSGVVDANDSLVAAHSRVTGLQAQQAKYATVPQVIAQVDAAVSARTLALGNDVLWYRYLNDLDGARPDGLTLSGITLGVNVTATTTTASNPLAPAGVGTVALQGAADQYDQVSSWLEALNKITGLSSSSLTNAAKTENGLTFSTGAVLDSDALSDRYTKKAG